MIPTSVTIISGGEKIKVSFAQYRAFLAIKDLGDRWTTAHSLGCSPFVLNSLWRKDPVERDLIPDNDPASKWGNWRYRRAGAERPIASELALMQFVSGWKAGAAASAATTEQMGRPDFWAGFQAGDKARLQAYRDATNHYGVTLSPLRTTI